MAHILAVDNNSINLEYIRYLFTSQGHSVRTATSVAQGLEMMEKRRPDVILSDLNLPHKTGFDFAKSVRAQAEWNDVPFLILSATSHSAKDVESARKLGVNKYLFRPIAPRELLREVDPFLKPGT